MVSYRLIDLQNYLMKIDGRNLSAGWLLPYPIAFPPFRLKAQVLVELIFSYRIRYMSLFENFQDHPQRFEIDGSQASLMLVKPKRKTNSRHPIWWKKLWLRWLVPSLGFFRVFRALRPLRSLNAVPQMKAKDKIQGKKISKFGVVYASKKHGSFFQMTNLKDETSLKKRACHSPWLLWWEAQLEGPESDRFLELKC